GVMFGAMGFLSTWDLPTHLLLLGLVLGVHGLLSARVGGPKEVAWAALSIGATIVLSVVFYLPFYQSFAAQSQAYGLAPVPVPTPAGPFLVFGGPLSLLTVTFLVSPALRAAGGRAAAWAAVLLVVAGAGLWYGPVVGLAAPPLVVTAGLVVRELRCRGHD